MRTKDEILKESFSQTEKVPNWDITASLHERLTIEVWIDIRDIIENKLTSFCNALQNYLDSR